MLLQLALAFALAQDPNEAQVLHAEMLGALLNAETLEINYKTEGKAKGVPSKLHEGRMLMQQPGSFYMKMEFKDPAKPETVVIISDGTLMKTNDKPAVAPPPDGGALKNYKGIVGLMGLSLYFNNKILRPIAPKMKDFKFGKKEGDVQAVEYVLDYSKPEWTVKTTVWIDVKSKLPTKRVTHLQAADAEVDFLDTYVGGVKVGEKIDPKWFVVPK